ncbi:hypothetical protein TWF106_002930 [Orbilia oligospora]|uniref:AB hydrolase-1 domain-containing protein n=1 Tax=Orbilia oligospora TaxID=2813651 RepID=A0A6G1MB46_ORBOL|nr:hypothetical protein TWF679_004327 [Orbilia oligospora]KAF3225049.1 hypothetical protein TWF106_002930 [Orbilia oligospora]KAF3226424.1 hypothetical protein TWF191_004686 [Orbilia oligospora]KAF3252598.1 hypothetical protein TWF192_004400 [Orbilia oligospora]
MAATRLRPISRALSTTSTATPQPYPTYHPSESQKFNLPDGRTLGFAEYGHPNGFPLFIFHGFPSSRIEAYPVDRLAHNLRVKLYSLERPGFGISTFQPGRKIIDYPSDVLAFAKGKGIERFSIVGASGGGPYAVACARFLPKEVMSGVCVFAGGPPWAAGRQYMQWWARWSEWLARVSPGTFTVLTNGLAGIVNWLIGTQWVTKRINKFLEDERKKKMERETPLPEDELGYLREEELTTDQRRERLLGLLWKEPWRQGSAGPIHEIKLLTALNWGFEFEDVQFPVKIYHGKRDINAPIEMIRWMAERLPNATLTEFDDTHFTMAGRLKQAIEEAIPEDEKKEFLEKQSSI